MSRARARLAPAAAVEVFGEATGGTVVCVPGDDERGVEATWHIVGQGGRHPLDGETFDTSDDARKALKAFAVR